MGNTNTHLDSEGMDAKNAREESEKGKSRQVEQKVGINWR